MAKTNIQDGESIAPDGTPDPTPLPFKYRIKPSLVNLTNLLLNEENVVFNKNWIETDHEIIDDRLEGGVDNPSFPEANPTFTV